MVIIGAGPAGLTAAYKLTSDYPDQYSVIVLEKENRVGGLSRTVDDGLLRFDIGGHRYYTDIPEVAKIWNSILPQEEFLTVTRASKIFYDNQLYDYPIRLTFRLIRRFGIYRGLRILAGFLKSQHTGTEINNLEDFYIAQFGRPLYALFFRDYTEKVWGRKPSEISPDWGRQRTDGLSLKQPLLPEAKTSKKNPTARTSVELFRYPQNGAGEMWDEMARKVTDRGGRIQFGETVTAVLPRSDNGYNIRCAGGREYRADCCLSSMPLKDLVLSFPNSPEQIRKIAEQLEYRDFIMIGVLLKKEDLKGHPFLKKDGTLIKVQPLADWKT